MLPDSTGTDLDQHLSNLVQGTTPPATAQMGGGHLITNNASQTNGTNGAGLLATRHQYTNSSEYIQSSQNGPRSLSDSSQAESPVQDDLLSSNTPTLGGQFQNQNYGSPSSNCNGSIYPVLPASILYSQLYTAANQGHSFHGHTLPGAQNSVHGELQTVMDHLSSGGRQNHHQLMSGHTDITIIGNCGSAARGTEVEGGRQLRGQQGPENGNSVWRPY